MDISLKTQVLQELINNKNVEYNVDKLLPKDVEFSDGQKKVVSERLYKLNEAFNLILKKDKGQLKDFKEQIGGNKMSEGLDIIQLLLAIIGFAPAYGDNIDVLNMMLYLIRGEFNLAMFALLSTLPYIGSAIGVPLIFLDKYKRSRQLPMSQNQQINYIPSTNESNDETEWKGWQGPNT